MKALVRQINRQASKHTVAMFAAANVLLALLWFTELYIPQSDTSRLNIQTIADNIALISSYKANVCLDTSALSDDAALRRQLDPWF